jgi:hypothetical protein
MTRRRNTYYVPAQHTRRPADAVTGDMIDASDRSRDDYIRVTLSAARLWVKTRGLNSDAVWLRAAGQSVLELAS